MINTMKIGRREYTITKVHNLTNNYGQKQTATDLIGKRGAQLTLIETHCKYGTVAKLIHYGRMSPAETVDPSTIQR